MASRLDSLPHGAQNVQLHVTKESLAPLFLLRAIHHLTAAKNKLLLFSDFQKSPGSQQVMCYWNILAKHNTISYNHPSVPGSKACLSSLFLTPLTLLESFFKAVMALWPEHLHNNVQTSV